MKTWWFLWRLFLFKRWTVTLQVGTAVVMMVVIEHAVALAQREVFDTLTGDAGISLGVWTLCAVLVALALGHAVGLYRRRDTVAVQPVRSGCPAPEKHLRPRP